MYEFRVDSCSWYLWRPNDSCETIFRTVTKCRKTYPSNQRPQAEKLMYLVSVESL